MADRDPVPLPAEVRAKLAELELELSEGEYLKCTAELGGSGPGCCCSGGCAGRTGSEFELCHELRSHLVRGPRPSAPVHLAVIWMQGGGGCFGGVSVRRKRAEPWTDRNHLAEDQKNNFTNATQEID